MSVRITIITWILDYTILVNLINLIANPIANIMYSQSYYFYSTNHCFVFTVTSTYYIVLYYVPCTREYTCSVPISTWFKILF